MSIGNLKDSGNQGNNFPWQLKMLMGQQCACDALKEIADNTDTVEPLLLQILSAIQAGTDYEAFLVVDNAGVNWLEIRIWNTGTGTFDPPVYFLAGSNTPGTPTAPITYINPNSYLAQIVSYTSNLVSIEAGIPNTLGQQTTANSMSVVLASGTNNSYYNRISGLNLTVTAGAKSVTVKNIGSDDITVDTDGSPAAILDPGVDLSWTAEEGKSLGAFTFTNSSGSSLFIVTQVR